MPSDMTSQLDSVSCVTWSVPEMPDNMRNDYQHARRRSLHGWAQWRTRVNNQLCQTTVHGDPLPEKLASIDKFLQKQLPRNHPAENPKTLLSYSAAQDSESNLRRNNFLIYGLPRVKITHKKVAEVPPTTDTRNSLDSAERSRGSRDYGRTWHPDAERSRKPFTGLSYQASDVIGDVISPSPSPPTSPDRQPYDFHDMTQSNFELRSNSHVDINSDMARSMMNLHLGQHEAEEDDIAPLVSRRHHLAPTSRSGRPKSLPRTQVHL